MAGGPDSTAITLTPDGITTTSVTVTDPSAAMVTTSTTSTANPGATAVSVTRNGLLVSQSTFSVTSPSYYQYDTLGRQSKIIDPRTGTGSQTFYLPDGRIDHSVDADGRTTQYEYYGATDFSAGLLKCTTLPGGASVRYDYDARDRPAHQWGTGTYPVQWGWQYDSKGVLSSATMTTYQGGSDWNATALPTSFSNGGSLSMVTTWTYDLPTGRLASVTRAGTSTTYSYRADGLLASSTNARGTVTSYGYDLAGRGISEGISSSPADVTRTYDRAGRLQKVMDAAGTADMSYDPVVQTLTNITYEGTASASGGILSGVQINYATSLGRKTGVVASWDTGPPLANISYGYDSAAGRLKTVTMGERTATYAYVTNSDLIQSVSYNTTTPTVGIRTYQNSGTLASLAWTGPGTSLPSHTYTLDAAGRRQTAAREDGSNWAYSYDDKGQVTLGTRNKPGTTTPKTGWYFGYGYDQFGNRTSYSSAPGSTYTATNDGATGQLTSPANPGSATLLARSSTDAVVSVLQNSSTTSLAVNRDSGSTDFSIAVPRSSGWESLSITATAPGATTPTTTRTGALYIPPAGEAFTYDADGNLSSDWRWNYVWDRKNQLTSMTTSAAAIAAGVPNLELDYSYDSFGRRIRKAVSVNSILVQEHRFVYDDSNLLAEASMLKSDRTFAPQPIYAYAWATDFGIPKILSDGDNELLLIQRYPASNASQFSFPVRDGNGNVISYIDATSGQTLARYEYDPFGRTIVAEEYSQRADAYVTASINTFFLSSTISPFRFSTKYNDDETGLIYYGFRYYSPEMGRWVSKDPIGEKGGTNLYEMVRNDPINEVDALGQKICHTQRIDRKLPSLNFDLGPVKGNLSGSIRGEFQLCDDCTKKLTAKISGSFGGAFPVWSVPGFDLSVTGNVEVQGAETATWTASGFDGVSGSLTLNGWLGLRGGNNLANVQGEGGVSSSWSVSGNADESSLGINFTGKEVSLNARVRVTVSFGKLYQYNQEILRVSKKVGTAPNFSLSLPLVNMMQ